MSCLNPVLVKSKAIGANAKQLMLVPCGKCIGCLRMRQDSWIYRLQSEQRHRNYSYFVTLTYDEKNVPLLLLDGSDSIITYQDYVSRKSIVDCVMTINPRDLMLYMKRLRKMSNVKFKYFACFEYGDEFDRPHMHFAIFFDDNPALMQLSIENCWLKGYVTIEPLIDSRITYVTKYINKSSLEAPPDEHCLPCQQRSSHGLGVDGFFSDEKQFLFTSDDYMSSVWLNNGTKIPLPRYFRRKYYPEVKFTIDKQLENEIDRNQKERIRFQRYRQDYILRTGNDDIEKITSAYLQNTDFERQRRLYDQVHKRRKGL